MEEFFPLLWPLTLCLKTEGLVFQSSRSCGWGLCVKMDLHFRRKKAERKCGFAPFSVFQHFSRENAEFFIFGWGSWSKTIRDGALGMILSPSGISHEFQHGYHVLLFSDVMHHGSTGLMDPFKEDHEFKAGTSGNKVQSIDSRRKHS